MSKGDEAGMYKSSENETFDGYNIPVALAAKIMGKISNISDKDWYKEFYQSELPLKEKAVSIMIIISVLSCFMNLRDTKLIIVNSISKITKGVSI